MTFGWKPAKVSVHDTFHEIDRGLYCKIAWEEPLPYVCSSRGTPFAENSFLVLDSRMRLLVSIKTIGTPGCGCDTVVYVLSTTLIYVVKAKITGRCEESALTGWPHTKQHTAGGANKQTAAAEVCQKYAI